MKIKVTKATVTIAQSDMEQAKREGTFSNRTDVSNGYGLAILRALATATVCNDTSKAGKREHVVSGGDSICLQWHDIFPDMGRNTRPDQGVERRLNTAIRLMPKSIGWGWVQVADEFHLVRTA